MPAVATFDGGQRRHKVAFFDVQIVMLGNQIDLKRWKLCRLVPFFVSQHLLLLKDFQGNLFLLGRAFLMFVIGGRSCGWACYHLARGVFIRFGWTLVVRKSVFRYGLRGQRLVTTGFPNCIAESGQLWFRWEQGTLGQLDWRFGY